MDKMSDIEHFSNYPILLCLDKIDNFKNDKSQQSMSPSLFEEKVTNSRLKEVSKESYIISTLKVDIGILSWHKSVQACYFSHAIYHTFLDAR